MKRQRIHMSHRVQCLFFALMLLLSVLAVPAYGSDAEPRETIRVGFFSFDGYHMVDEEGNRSGYGYDFLRMASRYMNVDYEYIGYENSWDDMLAMLEAGEIDLVTSVQATTERVGDYGFSKAIGSSSAMLTVRSDDETIIAGEYSTYDGIRIGVLDGNSRNDDLRGFAEEVGFSYTPIYFEYDDELEEALLSGQVDAALTSSLRKTEGERILDMFDTHDFYVVVRKDDTELLEKINYAIEQLNATEGDWQNDLANLYYEHEDEKNLDFTAKEQKLIHRYVSGEETLIITGSPDRSPYTYVEDGELKGIIVDYFVKLAEYIGIPYEIAVPSSREEYQRWQKEGPPTVFIDSRVASEKWVEDNSFSYSQPYTTMRLAMVTRRDFDGQINRLAVATAQGVFGIEDGLAPNAQRVEVSTRTEAMEAVLNGKADATFVYLYTAQQFINQDERGLLTYTILEEPAYEYHVGFTKNSTHELAGIFTKAIYAMPVGTFEDIASQYTSYRAQDVNLTTWIKIHPIFTLALGGVLFFTCLFAVLLAWRHKVFILEHKRAEEMEALAIQAEQANRAKSDFLANMSHDIRTPMNAIVGIANLMAQEQDIPEKLQDYTHKIQSSSRYLLGLIEDVLDMSRIEADRIDLTPEPVALDEMIRQMEELVSEQARERGLTFQVQLHGLEHGNVLVDGARLQQILMNLLSNALKYTPAGGQVELKLEEQPCHKPEWAKYTFSVTDNGCGMAPEFQKRLYEPFARNEASITNKIPGTGLGMAITKSLVDLMEGQITVDSALGRGTRMEVTLSLPIDTQEKAPAQQEEGELSLAGMSFLCAEDNALNAEILEAVLEMEQASCTVYASGKELVEAFRQVQPGAYDAILMDIQMPVMNGLEAARAIRGGENPLGKTIPIVAMSANAFKEDVEKSLDAGMNAHVSKPIDIGVMKKTILAVCGNPVNI